MDGSKTPVTVSSGCSLPCPSEASNQSSTSLSPAMFVHIPAKVGQGPGLPSPDVLSPLISASGGKFSPLNTPATPSESSPLPCPSQATTSRCFGPVSVNSIYKPSYLRFACDIDNESPLVNQTKSTGLASSTSIQGYATPFARARAQSFPNYLDFEDSPATVSSSSTLPVPSPSNTTSTCDPFI
ncbi:hypothetical protein BKA81DRAFT_351684 [Phyllosticta paracitricarpa]